MRRSNPHIPPTRTRRRRRLPQPPRKRPMLKLDARFTHRLMLIRTPIRSRLMPRHRRRPQPREIPPKPTLPREPRHPRTRTLIRHRHRIRMSHPPRRQPLPAPRHRRMIPTQPQPLSLRQRRHTAPPEPPRDPDLTGGPGTPEPRNTPNLRAGGSNGSTQPLSSRLPLVPCLHRRVRMSCGRWSVRALALASLRVGVACQRGGAMSGWT